VKRELVVSIIQRTL